MRLSSVVESVCLAIAISPFICYNYSQEYQVYAAVLAVCVLLWLWFRPKRRPTPHFDGWAAPGFEKVAEAFRHNVRTGHELGGAFAMYYRGQKVVDLWGGYMDLAIRRPWERDTIAMVFSSTKAVTAVVIGMLVDRGLLEYDKPVSYYWPEFGQHGKENILVKELLSHQSGLVNPDEKYRLSLIKEDPKELSRILAEDKPKWIPGKGQGYHALTYGLYACQLVQRVDPQGRDLSQFFREEIADPFGIDFYIGLPKHENYRCARITGGSFGLLNFLKEYIPAGVEFCTNVAKIFLGTNRNLLWQFRRNPTDWRDRKLNNPSFRELPVGSSHGFGSASALAKLFGIIACGGVQGDKRLLSKETIEKLYTVLTSRTDRVIMKKVAFGPGTIIHEPTKDNKLIGPVFGHFGIGGQAAFCDPHYELSWAYCTNYLNIVHGFRDDHRYSRLREAMYDCVTDISKSVST